MGSCQRRVSNTSPLFSSRAGGQELECRFVHQLMFPINTNMKSWPVETFGHAETDEAAWVGEVRFRVSSKISPDFCAFLVCSQFLSTLFAPLNFVMEKVESILPSSLWHQLTRI